MKSFRYEKVGLGGKRSRGIVEAVDVREALRILQTDEGKIVSLKELGNSEKSKYSFKVWSLLVVDDLQLYNINMRIAGQLKVGVPLLKALENISQTTSKKYERALKEVGEDLRQGASLGQALRKYPKLFPILMSNMIEIGENSGGLAVLLQDTAQYYKDTYELKKYLQQIALYPCLLLALSITMLSSFIFFVVPTFASLYGTLNIPLHPTLQLFLLIRGHFVGIVIVVLGVVLAMVAKVVYEKNKNNDYLYDLILRIYFIGDIFKKIQEVRFCRVLGMQLGVGVDLLTALEFAQKSICGSCIKNMCSQVSVELNKGRTLYEGIRKHNVFLSIETLEFLAAAENGGGYAEMLDIAHEQAVFNLKSLLDKMKVYLQPLVFLVIAIVLAVIIVVLLQPMLGIIENIGNNW